MGVPSFYRWLVNKYPKIVVQAVEEKRKRDDETLVLDTSLPNPNDMEFDNLYLDMNGIIHPCFHPEGDNPSPPESFEDVFRNIYEYIDRLFQIVRPRKLLYMAIDGVAPRAKMNQQRCRRFRTAKDCELAEAEEERLLREFKLEGKMALPKQESEISDSNIITPGTLFMHELSKALQSYVNLRLKNDNGWKSIKVILSDANVPGEGEHKIMSFIRMQRTFPDYDPDTRHCIYGLDADLIMLVLATHEVHFSILREDILVPEQPIYQFALKPDDDQVESTKNVFKCCKLKPYQFLHIWILREYLELDVKISDPPENVKIDLERIIDDFIFMCFFMGNDFLPHMPSLEIHEGGIDLLMHVYKTEFKKLGGYLVDTQLVGDQNMRYINLKRVEKFILSVGQKEEVIFRKRIELRDRKLRRLLSERFKAEEEDDGVFPSCSTSLLLATSDSGTPSNGSNSSPNDYVMMLENTKELKARLKTWSRDKQDLLKDGNMLADKVRLGSPGWRQRYYKEKFSAETKEMENVRKALVQNYTEGLCWVLLYYFSGVPSWTWFYNHHHGPFASDLRGMSCIKVKFEEGLPFKPFDQLMGVLPTRSAHALPKSYRELMTREDSTIKDFYPSDFEVDTDGKRFLWQGICKLPFIDEKRLTSETKKLEVELKADEVNRNSQKNDMLYVRSSNKLGPLIYGLYQKKLSEKSTEIIKASIPTDLSCGINGSISLLGEAFAMLRLTGVDTSKHATDIENDNVLCVQFELHDADRHFPRLLTHNLPEKTICEEDIIETPLWHEYPGSRPSYRPLFQASARKINEVQSNMEALNRGPIHKYAGTGWNSGRGKGCNPPTTELSGSCPSSPRLPIGHGRNPACPSSSYGYGSLHGRGRGQNSSSIGSGNSQTCGSFPKNVSYSRGGFSNKKTSTLDESSWRRPYVSMKDTYNEQIPSVNRDPTSTSGFHGSGNSQTYGSFPRNVSYQRTTTLNNNSWRRPYDAMKDAYNEPLHSVSREPMSTSGFCGRGRGVPNASASSVHWRVKNNDRPSANYK